MTPTPQLLTALLAEAVERVKNMTPEEREAMWIAQRESWVRGEMGMGETSAFSSLEAKIAELRGDDHIRRVSNMVGKDATDGTASPPDGVEERKITFALQIPQAGDPSLQFAPDVWAKKCRDLATMYLDLAAGYRKPVSPAPSGEAMEATKFADAAISWLNELPDRTSPDDWPEACLVTSDELHGYLVEQLQEFLTSDRAATEARVRESAARRIEGMDEQYGSEITDIFAKAVRGA